MNTYTFDELLLVMKRLRAECPWDKAQTNDSIKAHTIEEAYEVVEAIDFGNDEELRDELGDLLLHVVFHAQIASDEDRFSIDDVLKAIIDKLRRRHPHIFGDTKVNGPSDVEKNWEQIKMDEGRDSVIDGVPAMLPALLRAWRMQDKASKIGFDWERRDDVILKVREELNELHNAVETRDADEIENEMGDLLFSIVNYCRFIDVNPENALRRTIQKFDRRFRFIEQRLREEGRSVSLASPVEMNTYWEEAKKTEKIL